MSLGKVYGLRGATGEPPAAWLAWCRKQRGLIMHRNGSWVFVNDKKPRKGGRRKARG